MDQLFKRLRQPFPESSIEFVVTWSYGNTYDDIMIGVAPYIKRESVIVRLDHVCGAGKWKNELMPQPYGLYNGLSIWDGSNWITKWDGAAMNTSGKNDIDQVKSVGTQSLRRAAELWGVGMYLKELPQLFAVKRPPNEYDADEKSRIGRNNYQGDDVRWDHPPIPREFLPDHMTPEQYYLLTGLIKYFPKDKSKPIQDILAAFNNDESSVSYDLAAKKISDIQAFVKDRIRSHGKTSIYSQPIGRDYRVGEKPTSPASNKKEKPQPEKNATTHSVKEKESEQPTNVITSSKKEYAAKFRNAKAMLKALLNVNLREAGLAEGPVQKDLDMLVDAGKNKTPVPEEAIDDLLSHYGSMIVDLNNDDFDVPYTEK